MFSDLNDYTDEEIESMSEKARNEMICRGELPKDMSKYNWYSSYKVEI